MMIKRGYLKEYKRPFDWSRVAAFLAGMVVAIIVIGGAM